MRKELSFTLAEILIVISIIGIIFESTLPVLYKRYQQEVLINSWKKKYSEIYAVWETLKSDGYSVCNIDCHRPNYFPKGVSYNNPDAAMSDEYLDMFISKFKVLKSCSNRNKQSGCTSKDGFHGINDGHHCGTIYRTQTGATFGAASLWDITFSKVLLSADGSVLYVGGVHVPEVIVDVNGIKSPNIIGEDVFAVELNDDWLKPIGAEGTYNRNATDGDCICNQEPTNGFSQSMLGSSDLANGRPVRGICCSSAYLVK